MIETIAEENPGENKHYNNAELAKELRAHAPLYFEQLMAMLGDSWLSAECDAEFLGFTWHYKHLALIIPRKCVVYDFGCGMPAAQSWYFRHHKRYIGINPSFNYNDISGIPEQKELLLRTDNSIYYEGTAQQFLGQFGVDKRDKVAIVNYVPDQAAVRLIKERFANVWCYYPGM